MPKKKHEAPSGIALDAAVLMAELRSRGVCTIEVGYNGEGDSGQIESVSLLDARCNRVDNIPAGEGDNIDRIEEWVYQLLKKYHDGWENESGAYGELTVDLVTGTVTWEHHDRVTEYVTTEHTGVFLSSEVQRG